MAVSNNYSWRSVRMWIRRSLVKLPIFTLLECWQSGLLFLRCDIFSKFQPSSSLDIHLSLAYLFCPMTLKIIDFCLMSGVPSSISFPSNFFPICKVFHFPIFRVFFLPFDTSWNMLRSFRTDFELNRATVKLFFSLELSRFLGNLWNATLLQFHMALSIFIFKTETLLWSTLWMQNNTERVTQNESEELSQFLFKLGTL